MGGHLGEEADAFPLANFFESSAGRERGDCPLALRLAIGVVAVGGEAETVTGGVAFAFARYRNCTRAGGATEKKNEHARWARGSSVPRWPIWAEASRDGGRRQRCSCEVLPCGLSMTERARRRERVVVVCGGMRRKEANQRIQRPVNRPTQRIGIGGW